MQPVTIILQHVYLWYFNCQQCVCCSFREAALYFDKVGEIYDNEKKPENPKKHLLTSKICWRKRVTSKRETPEVEKDYGLWHYHLNVIIIHF